jgi:hypothetical protein
MAAQIERKGSITALARFFQRATPTLPCLPAAVHEQERGGVRRTHNICYQSEA